MEKIKITPFISILFWCIATSILPACRRDVGNTSTLRELYRKYENGMISECRYQGDLVYTAGLNAYDAGSTVYNADGREIGTCNYAWSNVDSICDMLTQCEVVYRVGDNIWGEPAVDKYGLGR